MSNKNSATCSIRCSAFRNRCLLTRDNRGITLIELLIVLVILAVLSTMAIPTYGRIKDVARETRAMEEIRGFEGTISAFAADRGTLPDTLSDVGLATMLDPWGRPYVYANIAKGGAARRSIATEFANSDFDLYSQGMDGATDLTSDFDGAVNKDDIVRAGEGAYVGLARNF